VHGNAVNIDAIRRTIEARPPIAIDDEGKLRPAAVLVPFVPAASGGLDVLMIRRTDTLSLHAGQIAFPGGSRDQGDASTIATALRETEEELGIPASAIEVIGELDRVRTSSDFVVSPIAGYLGARPNAAPNAGEVAEVLYLPFELFLSERTMEIRDFEDPKTGFVRKGVIYYRHEGVVVWGATARILKRLVDRMLSAPTDGGPSA
jgi:8-oxo-dGTP pyrophosphatase MutT (NUDIX family)